MDETIVYVNDHEANKQFNYPSNFIKTTTYTVFTFLPMALFMQFKKLSNLYFLINMIFSLIPGVAPVTPIAAILPLVFVILVAIIKEGVEEYKRHKADKKANSMEFEVLRDGGIERVQSRHLRVGDVVCLRGGEEVRADMFFLSSSTEEGQVYIDTCNLDGETSLKNRRSIPATQSLCTPELLTLARLKLRTVPPDSLLLSWNGSLEVNGEEHSVDINQFLYSGCVLRKVDWAWGFVIYAGKDTKMFRNLRKSPVKSSDLDHKLNKLILLVFVLQTFFIVTLCSLSLYWDMRHKDHWYIRWYMVQRPAYAKWFLSYFTFFILLSYLIPISLFVTMEICKVIQAYWMTLDKGMMEIVNGAKRKCVANTSNLNEQLAMVRFIFSDKTGTLTENVMRFKVGDIYGHELSGDDLEGSLEKLNQEDDNVRAAAYDYFLALSICNTIQPFSDADSASGITYDGTSPDEVAFVNTAAKCGFRLIERTLRYLTVEINGHKCVFDILATLEFTSDRKMMSVIVLERDTGRIILFTKGADSIVEKHLCDSPYVHNYMRDLSVTLLSMSEIGLRTLLFATRDISQKEFDSWNREFLEAGRLLVCRSEAVDNVCLKIENNLRLLGATGIEDKLQDEVPETISFFLKAGVIIWMLTGDKRETAVTIGATAALCDPRRDKIVHVDIGSLDQNDPRAIEKVGMDLRQVELSIEECRQQEDGGRCTLVVDGPALHLATEHFNTLFFQVAMQVDSAICCRLTPLQKANIVRMFQTSTGQTAIAIGDGANDVSMIREGRVGVGIIGLEGSQAALSADYAIPRFKNLRRLCAVHGRYSLLRNSSCILTSFYKNFVLTFIQVIFAFYTGFSGLTLYDGWLLTFYNVVMTSIPPFFMGIFERDLPPELLESRPDLFAPLSRGMYFSFLIFALWLAEAIFHAVVIFYIAYPIFLNFDYDTTYSVGGSFVGTLILSVVVFVVLSRFILHLRYWSIALCLGMGCSFLLFIAFVFIYCLIRYIGDSSIYWHIYVLIAGPNMWLCLVLAVGTLIVVVDVSLMCFKNYMFPSDVDIAKQEYFETLRAEEARRRRMSSQQQVFEA